MTGEKQTQATLETILRPGQIVGEKYCVDKLIGKGGMAAVWAGTNQRTGKCIALKVILRSFASNNDASELFRREAMAASRVNHPNVVNVFDVIDHEGMTCIVMEMLNGEPLSAYLTRKGFLKVDEAIALLLPAMRGVASANAQGVIHRDLKPQNIFICIGPDGRLLTTKVLDFGISVMVERAMDGSTTTVQLATHGTPAYMCPEHITGSPNIDERADVYGFGVLFFEALTGQLPFLGEPGPALLIRILNEPPPKVTLFRPDLPPAMVEIIERAMAKNPELRYPNLDHFIRAIEEHMLPSSSLPRSLTPMVGVPMFATSEPKSGVADPVVQVVHRSEPSGLHEINETKELYTLPRNVTPAEGEPSRKLVTLNRTGEVPPPTTTQVNLKSSLGRDMRRWIGSRIITGAVFVGVIGLVIWLAFPMPTQQRNPITKPGESLPSSEPIPSPPVPLPGKVEITSPTAPIPSPEEKVPAMADTVSAESVAEAKPESKSVKKSKTSKASAKAKAVRARAGIIASSGLEGEATAVESRKKKSIPAKDSTPRAGSLSPDDF